MLKSDSEDETKQYLRESLRIKHIVSWYERMIEVFSKSIPSNAIKKELTFSSMFKSHSGVKPDMEFNDYLDDYTLLPISTNAFKIIDHFAKNQQSFKDVSVQSPFQFSI